MRHFPCSQSEWKMFMQSFCNAWLNSPSLYRKRTQNCIYDPSTRTFFHSNAVSPGKNSNMMLMMLIFMMGDLHPQGSFQGTNVPHSLPFLPWSLSFTLRDVLLMIPSFVSSPLPKQEFLQNSSSWSCALDNVSPEALQQECT